MEIFLDAPRKAFVAAARQFDIRWTDAVRGLPLADNAAAEAVYTSHMLEHLDREEARQCLREVNRILSPGGLLRIVVPDLRSLCEHYMKSGDADEFMGSSLLAFPKPKTLSARRIFTVVGGRHHHWMYDATSLSRLLREAGFIDITQIEPGVTRLSSPDALDLAERAAGSIYIEALKPT